MTTVYYRYEMHIMLPLIKWLVILLAILQIGYFKYTYRFYNKNKWTLLDVKKLKRQLSDALEF